MKEGWTSGLIIPRRLCLRGAFFFMEEDRANGWMYGKQRQHMGELGMGGMGLVGGIYRCRHTLNHLVGRVESHLETSILIRS
jgi:hypothetical protein